MASLIHAALLYETRELDLLDDFMDAFPGLAEEAIRDDWSVQIKPGLLDELRHTPGAVVHPFVWSLDPAANARARGWYFAALRAGRIPTSGSSYARSGHMVAGWEVDVIIGDDAIALVASNRSRALPWVTGKRQVPGHATTGWPLHQPTLDFWAEAAREQARETVTRLMNGR